MDVNGLLLKYGQSPSLIDPEKHLSAFSEEMQKGLCGESSVAMLPTYLYEGVPDARSAGKRVIVIDAGGTNFRSAVGYIKEDGSAVFIDEQKTVMPATLGKRLSAEEFYAEIGANVSRLLGKGTDIGFCFSYPVRMEADGDGVISAFTKAVDAPSAVGTRVGENTLRAVRKYSDKKRNIVILNDTAAALLGGLASVRGGYSAYVGYIYGTGTNICYSERTENIVKAAGLPAARKMLINTECGNYNKFPQGIIDKKLADATDDPERQLFEKMTSGKYLSSVISGTFKAAACEGVMTGVPAEEFSLKEVSEFLAGEKNSLYLSFGNGADRDAAREICLAYIDRAARLGAIANAAAVIRSASAGGTAAIFAEGTTFEKLYGYKERFAAYLSALLSPRGINFEIIRGEELNLKGCLAAALGSSG